MIEIAEKSVIIHHLAIFLHHHGVICSVRGSECCITVLGMELYILANFKASFSLV